MRIIAAIFLLTGIAAIGAVAAAEDRLSTAFAFSEKENYQEAYAAALPLAEEGVAAAQFLLGYLYQHGLGTEKNMREALHQYERAALSGYDDAQYALAELAINGGEIKQDYERATGWLKLAVMRGHPQAQSRLGALYLDGLGVGRNQAHAVTLFQEAARAGLPAAMTAMGLLVHQGADGAGRTTADWFEQAAIAGDPQGQFLFAVALGEGDGREIDTDAALYWLNQALTQEGALPSDMREGAMALRRTLSPDGT